MLPRAVQRLVRLLWNSSAVQEMLQWKYSQFFIPILWGTGLAMAGVALGLASLDIDYRPAFALGYSFVAGSFCGP